VTVSSTGNFYLTNGSAATASFNMSGGSLLVTKNLITGQGNGSTNGSGGNSIFTQSGGTINVPYNSALNEVDFSNWGGTTTASFSGGVFQTATYYGVTFGQRGPANVTIGGTALLNLSNKLQLGGAGGAGTVNLNGGTLAVNNLTKGSGGGTFNFNGGLLVANAGSTAFLVESNAYVQSSGAYISSNGYNITIGQALLDDGTHTGGLTKSGAGMLTLTAANTYGGGTSVSAGTLQMGNASALGAGGPLTVNGSVLDLKSYSPTVGVLAGSGTIFSSAAGSTPALTINQNSSTTFSGVLANGNATALGLTVNGASALTLDGANTYSGPTAISGGGTLALGPAGTLGSGNVTIAPGSVLDVSAYGGGGNYSLGNCVLNAGRTGFPATDINGALNASNITLTQAGSNSTMTISGSLAMSGGTVNYYPGDTIALSSGALSLNNTEYIVPQTPLNADVYTLFSYPLGNLAAGTTANLAMAGANGTSPRQTYTFDTSSGSAVTLTVGGLAGNLFWTGTGDGTWYTGAGPQNWFNTNKIGGAGPDVFYASDAVTFDDTAGSAYGNVTISGTVAPLSITISNTAVAYTFSGTGSIVGATSLALNGPNSLTIANGNAYTGGTNLYGGTLNLANSAAIGSSMLTINGGTLDNTSGAAMTLSGNNPQNWANSFTFLGSSPLNLGIGAVTMNASPTVTVSGTGALTVGGGIAGTGALTKNGGGTLVLSGSSGYSGGTTLANGALGVNNNNALGTGALTINGGTLDSTVSGITLANNAQYWNGDFAFNGTQNLSMGTGAISLGSDRTVTVNANTLTVGGAIGGLGLSLTLAGSGTLLLGGNLAYTGSTVVNGGTVNISGPASAIHQTTVVNPTATLVLTTAGPFTGLTNSYPMYVNGGNVDWYSSNANPSRIYLTGGSVAMQSGGIAYLRYGIEADAAAVTSVIGGPGALQLVSDQVGNAPIDFTVQAGTASVGLLVTAPIGRTGGLSLNGGGTMVLASNCTYSGTTSINAGTLQIGNGGTTGALAASGYILDNATLVFNRSDNIAQGSQFSSAAIAGYGGLVQAGSGMLTLNAANTFGGGTTISSGTLSAATIASGASNLGNANTAIALGGTSTPGTLLYTGNSTTFAPGLAINPGGGKLVVSTAGQTLTLGSATWGSSGALAIGGAGNTTLQSSLPGGITTLNKTDGGMLVLAGGDTYSGATTINGGGLYMNGLNATPSISLASGGTLGGIGSAPSAAASVANGGVLDFSQNSGSTFALSGLTFQGLANVNVGSLASYSFSPVLNVTGSNGLAANGLNQSVTFVLSGMAPAVSGTAQLIQYNGAIGGTGSAAFTSVNYSGLSGLSNRDSFQVINPPGYIALQYTVVSPVWTGALNGIWDTGSQGAPENWVLSSDHVTSTYFMFNDTPIFDDTAGTNTVVSISAGDVHPTLVTFGNMTRSYTLNGTHGIVGGASMVINGGGAVTIANSNGYTGGTSLVNGTLDANAASALGSGTVAVSGGVLNANVAGALGACPVSVISGVLNDLAANSLGTGALTINGGTVNANNPQSLASATLNNGGLLNLAGPNAFNGATLTLSGGSLDNSSGSAMTLAGNVPQNWNGAFTFVGTSPLNTGTSAVTLNGSPSVFVNANELTVGGVIGGTGALAKNGTGALVLTASNGYGGTTTITAGTLQLGTGIAGQDGSINSTSGATDNGTLIYNLNGNQTAGYPIGGSGTLLKTGPAVLTLTASNGYGGGTLVTAGTLQVGNTHALGAASSNLQISSATVDLAGFSPMVGGLAGNSAALILNSSTSAATLTVSPAAGSATYAGAINNGAGTTAFTVNGAGEQVLTGINGYTGATNITGGTLTVATGGMINSGTSGIFVAGSATPVLNIAGGSVVATFNNNAFVGVSTSNPGAVVISSGTLAISTVGNGTVTIGQYANATWTQTGGVATFNFSGQYPEIETANFAGTTNFDISGGVFNVTGSGSSNPVPGMVLPQRGTATFTVEGAASVNIPRIGLAGQSTGVGTFNLNGGTLTTATVYPGAGSGTFNFNGGLLVASTNSTAFMTGLTNANVAEGGALINTNGYNIAIGQTLAHGGIEMVDGGLTKLGDGTLTLTSPNAYNGLTTVQAGVLQVDASQAVPGSTTVSGGTLDVEADDAGGLVTLASGAVTGAATLSGSGYLVQSGTISANLGDEGGSALLKSTSAAVILSGSSGYTGGTTVNDGTLIATSSAAILDGTNLSVGDPGLLGLLPAAVVPSAAAALRTEPQGGAIAPVPEPGTLALLAFGLWSATIYRRFRRRS
jgi:fibronectin-binding autotransporter adhesin